MPVHRTHVHHRDVEREQRVRHRDQLWMLLEAVADGQCVHREEEHLRQHERPLDRTVVAVAVAWSVVASQINHVAANAASTAPMRPMSGSKLMASL